VEGDEERLKELAERIRRGGPIGEIGEALAEAKDLLHHGEWLPWLKGNFGWGARSAQLAMRVYRKRSAMVPITLFKSRKKRSAPVRHVVTTH